MNNSIRISLYILAILLSACSIHSSQLSTLQGILSDDETALEDVAWTASWNGNDYLLYAVSAPAETIFAYDREIRVHFDGWNITQVVGILPSEAEMTIESFVTGEMLFYLNDRLLAEHKCDPWKSVSSESGEKSFVQECAGRESYRNQIDVAPEGNITRLTFTIHPEYPQIDLAYQNFEQ